MKILYRLRFIPLVLLILFFLYTILGVVGYFSIMAVVALPYQDPTPEMVINQVEMLQALRDGIPRVVGEVAVAFGAMILYIVLLVFLRYRRKKSIDTLIPMAVDESEIHE